MDSSPTSLFENYEQDFEQVIASVREKLDADGPNMRGDERKAALRRVELELDEAEELVSQMEIELPSMPQSIEPTYQKRWNDTKRSLASAKAHARTLHTTVNRAALLSDAGGSPFRDSTDDEGGIGMTDDRARLLRGTSRLETGSRRLLDAQRVAEETTEQGNDILRDLRRQREQIENSRETLRTADSALIRASGTLKGMIRRMYQQRVVTAAIIVVLIILILVILYEKLA